MPEVDYRDETTRILGMVVQKHAEKELPAPFSGTPRISGFKDLRRLTLRTVLTKMAKK
jgi:hypothetical protein